MLPGGWRPHLLSFPQDPTGRLTSHLIWFRTTLRSPHTGWKWQEGLRLMTEIQPRADSGSLAPEDARRWCYSAAPYPQPHL